MRYHLLQKFFGKMVKIKETTFLSTRGMGLMFGNCIALKNWKSNYQGVIETFEISYILVARGCNWFCIFRYITVL